MYSFVTNGAIVCCHCHQLLQLVWHIIVTCTSDVTHDILSIVMLFPWVVTSCHTTKSTIDYQFKLLVNEYHSVWVKWFVMLCTYVTNDIIWWKCYFNHGHIVAPLSISHFSSIITNVISHYWCDYQCHHQLTHRRKPCCITMTMTTAY